MAEVLDFLTGPEKYSALGAKLPRGAIIIKHVIFMMISSKNVRLATLPRKHVTIRMDFQQTRYNQDASPQTR
eukprot:9074445-Pyramimonas_sp.AAC.2